MKSNKKIELMEWKPFKVKNIFKDIIKPTVYHTRQVTEEVNGIPYIVRSKYNNGIKYRVKRPREKVNPPGVISFGAENATFFYQDEEWISGRDMYYIDTRHLSKNVCLFLTACFQPLAEKYSYNFGLFPKLLREETVYLPTKSGEIDYNYMETYIMDIMLKIKTNIKYLTEK